LFDTSKDTTAGLAVSSDSSCSPGKRVLVLGLGNILLKDEGIGVHVVEQLQKNNLPSNVQVIDGGTAGMDILLWVADAGKLVVVDAIKTGKKPGTIYKISLKAEEKEKLTWIFKEETSKVSLHQVGLLEALSVAERLGRAPEEIVVIGVEPDHVDYGLELTELLKQKVPEVIKEILEEIEDDIHGE